MQHPKETWHRKNINVPPTNSWRTTLVR